LIHFDIQVDHIFLAKFGYPSFACAPFARGSSSYSKRVHLHRLREPFDHEPEHHMLISRLMMGAFMLRQVIK
jgi:hypothetical protein